MDGRGGSEEGGRQEREGGAVPVHSGGHERPSARLTAQPWQRASQHSRSQRTVVAGGGEIVVVGVGAQAAGQRREKVLAPLR